MVLKKAKQKHYYMDKKPHHDDGLSRAVLVAQAVEGQQAQHGVEGQRGQVAEV